LQILEKMDLRNPGNNTLIWGLNFLNPTDAMTSAIQNALAPTAKGAFIY